MKGATPAGASDEPKAFIRKAVISNIGIGFVLSIFFSVLLFSDKPLFTPFAPDRAALGIFPATFNVTVLMTIGMTLSVRSRARRGIVRAPDQGELPAASRWLPKPLMARAIAFAAAVTLILAPPTLLVVWGATHIGLLPGQWSLIGLIAYYAAYFAVHAMTVPPILIWRALCEAEGRQA
ncbi:hypothetical protein Swit_1525 [Rhizorhabdus wittichii RW1]|uniref:Uncharacterized protein n=1 Tax=Rhizorhabdus wittichii (strain DSM 6014 / CCUG 31198 / JCM 15750 / NBRC 105917 / EY 4224 / RW1) TaxID=392499 RepID=A0A9J9HA74_RHIWR|nr:hypothetical protein Swit_1525 [Rhizorhabdus wittichii RW1]